MPVYLLSEELIFPPPELAEPQGLLALGGDLSVERLILAYKMGIFPWYSEGEPILWWSPDPRMVLFPEKLHVSKRLNRLLKQGKFQVTFDKAFEQVIKECANVRIEQGQETWLTNEMISAYIELHKAGYAHSVEAWHQNKLAGGLYGIAMGQLFFGESMFTRITNGSKIAFVTLVKQLKKWNFKLIDCQVASHHLGHFGAEEIARKEFLKHLRMFIDKPNLAPLPYWDIES